MKKDNKTLLQDAADKARAEERLRTLQTLLAFTSPQVLLSDPKFKTLGYTQREISAAQQPVKKEARRQSRKKVAVPAVNREVIKNYCLLDNEFMRAVLKDNVPGVQDIIRIILERPDLTVVSVETEADYPNLHGHGVRFDVLAQDASGNLYDIEIQRDKRGASPRRARYCLSALDWNKSRSGDDYYEKLPETWVIFITEDDLYTHGAPFVDVERYFVGTGAKFEDGQHIRFVSAKYVGDDPIGRLMADFNETDPAKMTTPSLAQPAQTLKCTEKGIEEMSATIDSLLKDREEKAEKRGEKKGRVEGRVEGRAEGRAEGRVQTIGLLLACNSPEALMHAPQFQPLGVTQAEIDAALALNR